MPNPANDWITLRYEQDVFKRNLPVEIIDIWGRNLQQHILSSINSTTLNVRLLSYGIYFVKIGGLTRRFVINKN